MRLTCAVETVSYMAVTGEDHDLKFKWREQITSASKIIESEATHQFKVITGNHVLAEAHPYPLLGIRTSQGVNATIGNIRLGTVGIQWIVRQLHRDKTISYLMDSLKNTGSTLSSLLSINVRVLQKKPVLLVPRGEMSTNALGLKSLKKNTRPPIIKRLIDSKVTWQFSSDDKLQQVQPSWGGLLRHSHKPIIRSNPIVFPINPTRTGPADGEPVNVFASRQEKIPTNRLSYTT